MANLKLFEDLVRACLKNIAPNRVPKEDELQQASDMVKPMLPDITENEIDFVIKKLQSALDVEMDVGISIETPYTPWLNALKAKESSDYWYYWNRYVLYLEEDMQRPSNIIATIDNVSDKIVDLAGNPQSGGILHRRGLLIGDVQSGKTANYIAIMNKAADVGYRVIILLTGTVESLRRQTQERVDEGFIGRSSKAYLQRNSQTLRKGVGLKDANRFATGFTTEASDFKKATLNSMNVNLDNMTKEPVVFVLKKNARTLENLIGWLEDNKKGNGKINYPLLLIDDEADNASINTKEDNNPTTINRHIRKLLSLFNSSSYIAVTATPFANIFILPEKTEEMENDDLFPSDYIYSLDAPTNYIGSNELFGDDASYSKSLATLDDAGDYFPYKHKQDIPINSLPDSLYSALRYFILANVARDINGDKTAHRSMLVNVSRFVLVQNKISQKINEWLFESIQDIKHYCMLDEEEACKNPFLNALREDWYKTNYPFFEKYAIPWEIIQKEYLYNAVSPIEVRTINQKSSTKMLDYAMYNDTGLRVIAVGGLSLSRGLTLEGLMVSYFHRNTQMYDTLMQMGRWFGYRSGYEDLFRIWMPDDAIGWYAHITQAANELREEISRMNRLGATPKEFGLKVRAHPTTLIITAKNKMKHSERVERWITLDGSFFETPRFRPNIDIIRGNRNRTDSFLKDIITQCGNPVGSGKQPLFWTNVPSDIICDYLSKYNNHPMNMEANSDTLIKYIKNNNEFETWDVLVYSSKSSEISHRICGIPIRPTKRPFSRKPVPYSVYGSKLRIGTMGLTKYGLTDKQKAEAENDFREYKRSEYEKKYGNAAEDKLSKMSFPDRAYLIKGRNPIIIIHYLLPDSENAIDDFDMNNDLIVGYGMGFPRSAGSEPIYAVYYLNLVEQREYMDDEIEEDQLDDED
ncbi:Z1 domain-containing protein [Ruminococcus flavefaciens]|uniref:Z1 domain-containing protein n=1 Tax=Ruminococcus flavefaciens TaxID=1265 RepID=UPI00048F4169|nr:Z1 domain-containing protein [Ruminococcus flavefaciens]